MVLGIIFKETSVKFTFFFLYNLPLSPLIPINVLLSIENLNPVLKWLITVAYLSLLLLVICSANLLKKNVHSGPIPPDVVKIRGVKVILYLKIIP